MNLQFTNACMPWPLFVFFQVSISLIITEFTAGYVGNYKATAETSDSEGWLRIGLAFLLLRL